MRKKIYQDLLLVLIGEYLTLSVESLSPPSGNKSNYTNTAHHSLPCACHCLVQKTLSIL